MKTYVPFLNIILSLCLFGCKPDSTSTDVPELPKEDLVVHFSHLIDGQTVQFDTMRYVNLNGDTFSIKTLKYFVSRMTFYKKDGSQFVLDAKLYQDGVVHETLEKSFMKVIPRGEYTGVRFVMGFINEDNESNMFTQNPEYLMFWPENMGGGYHYQKLEGQYLENGIKHNFNFHAGALDGVDYSIPVQFSNLPFEVKGESVNLSIRMEIQNWFADPHIWDFSYFGSAIMQNQEAQETIQKNGHNVFSINVK